MLGFGVFFLAMAVTLAGALGTGVSTTQLLSRLAPGVLRWLSNAVLRHGWPNAWPDVVRPALDAPAWLPLGLLGLTFLLIGIARRDS